METTGEVPFDELGAVIVRARHGVDRHVRSGSVGLHSRGGSWLDRFFPRGPNLEYRVEIVIDPTPDRYLDDSGAAPGYVIDDFVTRGGIPR